LSVSTQLRDRTLGPIDDEAGRAGIEPRLVGKCSVDPPEH